MFADSIVTIFILVFSNTFGIYNERTRDTTMAERTTC